MMDSYTLYIKNPATDEWEDIPALRGEKGAQGIRGEHGIQGNDGYSPEVTITEITGGHRVTITDADGAHSFDVLDGQGGGGGTSDHTQLTNRDAENQHPMSAIIGLVTALAAKGTYSKPNTGIPYADLAAAVQASLGRADTALQTAPVSSVNGKTGVVNLVPADLGIGSMFQLKGSKPTYADLPSTGNTIGDVWYVVADSVGYIWLNDGTVDRWEQLGMEIDLSAYRTAAAQDIIDNGKIAISQGVSHAGEFLVVGSDGNVTTATLPIYDGGVE